MSNRFARASLVGHIRRCTARPRSFGHERRGSPAISSSWPSCRLTYRLPDRNTQYEILIENPNGKEHGVASATLDGRPAVVANAVARVPLVSDGALHQVIIRL